MTGRRQGYATWAMVGTLVVTLVAFVLAGCGGSGGGGSAANDASPQTGTITLNIARSAQGEKDRSQPRLIPPTTTDFRIDVLDPDTKSPLVPSQTVSFATQTVAVTVRVGPVLVGISALNELGTVLQTMPIRSLAKRSPPRR